MFMVKKVKKYLRGDEVHEALTHYLSGKIFHVTNNRGIKGILRSGVIHHNNDKRFSLAHGGQTGYGLRNGFVSFFDLRHISKEDDTLSQSYECLYYPRPNNWSKYSYLIFNSKHYNKLKFQNRNNPKSLKSILPNKTRLPSAEEPANFIPKFECWFPSKCPIYFISEILDIEIIWDNDEKKKQEINEAFLKGRSGEQTKNFLSSFGGFSRTPFHFLEK